MEESQEHTADICGIRGSHDHERGSEEAPFTSDTSAQFLTVKSSGSCLVSSFHIKEILRCLCLLLSVMHSPTRL